jgi:RluA family pseudouridine synthase
LVTANLIKLSAPATGEFWKISVLYEDEHLLAIDKPSRLLTSPDRYDRERPNLMKLLHRDIERGAPWAHTRQLTYLMNAHRLDFETSGVLLLAKNKPALVALANLFGSEKPNKTYLALAHGAPAQNEFEVGASLAPHPTEPGRVRVDEKRGKRAKTLFRTLEWFQGYTLLEARPLTGRTHQIRVHASYVRLPLVGDGTYGGRKLLLSRLKQGYRLKPDRTERPLLDRTALHAAQLSLPHPVTQAVVTIDAPLPKDLQVALKYLRKFATST